MKHTPTPSPETRRKCVAWALAISLLVTNVGQAHAITYDAANAEYFDTIDDYGLAGGSASVTLRFGGTLGEFLRFNQTLGRFVLSDDLDVQGTLSGHALKIAGTAALSGALVMEAGTTLSGSALRGFGLLTDCDDGTNSKLLWDSTTGRFSCGSDQSGGGTSGGGISQSAADSRYVNAHGDTMTGKLVLNRTSLGIVGSGTIVAHDGTDNVLVVKGTGSQMGDLQQWNSNVDSVMANINYNGAFWTQENVSAHSLLMRGNTNCDTVDTDGNGLLICGSDNVGITDESDPYYFSNPNGYITSGSDNIGNDTYFNVSNGSYSETINTFDTIQFTNDSFINVNVSSTDTISITSNNTYANDMDQNVGTDDSVTFQNLNVSGNTTLGSGTSYNVTFGALIASHFLPSGDATYDLGNTSARWNTGYFGSLDVEGHAIAEDASLGSNSDHAYLGFNRDATTGTIFDSSRYAYQFTRPVGANHFMLEAYNGAGTKIGNAFAASGARIGVGTVDPSSKLHVYNSGGPSIMVEDSGGDGASVFLKTTDGQWNLSTDGSGNFQVYDSDSSLTRMLVDATGNVGIGTSTPSEKLHIKGDNAGVRIEDGSSTEHYKIHRNDSTGYMEFMGSQNNFSGFRWIIDDTNEAMTLRAITGNVGIGTDAPDYKLDVNGAMIAAPPAAQTISAGGTITADACGTVKMITASSSVTTNTTNTFTAPSSANAGCVMHVVNAQATWVITLDANTNFKTPSGVNVTLSPHYAVTVVSSGTYWYVMASPSANF